MQLFRRIWASLLVLATAGGVCISRSGAAPFPFKATCAALLEIRPDAWSAPMAFEYLLNKTVLRDEVRGQTIRIRAFDLTPVVDAVLKAFERDEPVLEIGGYMFRATIERNLLMIRMPLVTTSLVELHVPRGDPLAYQGLVARALSHRVVFDFVDQTGKKVGEGDVSFDPVNGKGELLRLYLDDTMQGRRIGTTVLRVLRAAVPPGTPFTLHSTNAPTLDVIAPLYREAFRRDKTLRTPSTEARREAARRAIELSDADPRGAVWVQVLTRSGWTITGLSFSVYGPIFEFE